MLTRSVELLADLPITRAIMTSPDPVDDSGCVPGRVADRGQRLVRAGRPQRQSGRTSYQDSGLYPRGGRAILSAVANREEDSSHWWFGEHHLYQALVSRSIAVRATDGTLLGFLIIGHEIDDRLAREVSKVAASQVAFSYGNEVVATTLTSAQMQDGGVRDLIAGASAR